ncbi:MAG: hypothetical protein HOH16_00025 [Planctomycetaceae bacterium]|jgi:hypothetical protein|nr:hypothetical protein [Planctomycetaceae bacterium]
MLPLGSAVEKWDTAGNQWVDASAPATTGHPSELIRLMRRRVIQEGDQVCWIPSETARASQRAFGVIDSDDGADIPPVLCLKEKQTVHACSALPAEVARSTTC